MNPSYTLNEASAIQAHVRKMPQKELQKFYVYKGRVKKRNNLSDEEAVVVTFNHYFATAHPLPEDQATLKVKQTAVQKEKINKLESSLALVGSGFGVILCTATLVYLQAKASGFDVQGWLWAFFAEIFGVAFVSFPAGDRIRKSFYVLVGICCLGMGFMVQETEIVTTHKASEQKSTIENTHLESIDEQIILAKDLIKSSKEILSSTPANWKLRRTELISEIKTNGDKLLALQESKARLMGQKSIKDGDAVSDRTRQIETGRRILMLIVNLMLGHTFARVLKSRYS